MSANTDPVTRSVTCDFCSQPFEPKRNDARYCSTRCRVSAHRREQERLRLVAIREASIARRAEMDRAAAEADLKQREAFVVTMTKVTSRLTFSKANEIYDALLAADLVKRPFVQMDMFRR